MAVIDPYKAAKTTAVQKVNTSIPAPAGGTSATKVIGSVGAQSVPQPPAQQQTFSSPQYSDWLTKQNETFANLEKLVNTPFSYDPQTDPGYLAQQQLAQQRAGVATRNALETANEKGILGSSMNVGQLGQIQQTAEQEAAAYIPIYREQAYNQHQNRLADAASLLTQARALRGDQFGEGVTEAQLTGNYMSPEARTMLNNLLDLKTNTEANWSTMSAEQRAAARSQGDQLRAQLQGMGIDSTLYGADVAANAARGNLSQAGLRTLAGQELDFGRQVDQRNYDRGVTESDRNYERGVLESDRNYDFTKAQQEWDNAFKQGQFDFTKAQQVWENSFQEKNFEQSMREAAASRGLQWASLNQRQQEFIADMAWREKQFEYQMGQDAIQNDLNAAKQSAGKSAEDYYDAIDKSIYLSPETINMGYGDPVKTGKTVVNNRDGLEGYILSLNLSDAETTKLYRRYGISDK